MSAQDTEGTWDKWLVADVVCHEVAHQWFGDLVTCSAWQDLTVNEVCLYCAFAGLGLG